MPRAPDLIAAPKITPIPEPLKKTIHVQESAEPICFVGLVYGNDAMGQAAIYKNNQLIDIAWAAVNENNSLEISVPLTAEIAEAYLNRAIRASYLGSLKCKCGKRTNFKLVDMEE